MSSCDEPSADAPCARLLRYRAALDRVLVASVVLLALAQTATPVSNSDVWLHLATGRHIVQHPAELGILQPLDASTGPRRNPSWLFDTVCYAVYTVGGEAALALLRSLLIVLLAVALLRACRNGVGWWVPAIATGAAIVALAPRLQLQPVLLSLLFFTLTLTWLERHADDDRGAARHSWRSGLALYVLFLVWANTDGWFLLGLVAVACYWLGGKLRPRGRMPVSVLLGAVLICLVNPSGIHAFRLPADLSWPTLHPDLGADPFLAPLYASPWLVGIRQGGLLRSVEGGALTVLVLAAVVALALRRRDARTAPRAMLLAVATCLWLYQSRNAPILAVTAAVMAARTLQEAATGWFHARPDYELRLRQAVVGRFGTVAVCLAAVVLAGLGRLQIGNALPERRGWGVERDPSLVQAAETLQEWRAHGRLPPEARGWNVAPEMANYLAWFAPLEPGSFASHLEVSPQAAADFVTVRRGLLEPPTAPGADDSRTVLRRQRVTHVILGERDASRMQAMLNRVLAAPDEWRVLLQAGRTLVVAWRDPGTSMPALDLGPTADLSERGLHPEPDAEAPLTPPAQPAAPWWRAVLPLARAPSLARDDAALSLMCFDALLPPTTRASARQWQLACVGAALVGDARTAVVPLGWLAGRWARQLQADYLATHDDAPPGYLWSAVRAARRALAQHPDDADARLLLGEAYCRLVAHTGERAARARLPRLLQLHKLQAIHALQQAVRLRPNLAQAHLRLAALYQDSRYLDLALRHLAAFAQLQAQRGPQPGETPAQYDERLNAIRKVMADLEHTVAQRQAAYQQQAAGLNAAGQARLADQLGLATTALDVLLGSDIAAFGHDGLLLELDLMMAAGRSAEARRWLEASHEQALGQTSYHWLAARFAALAGDYATADAHLRQLQVDAVPVPELAGRTAEPGQALAITVAANVLAGARRATQPLPLGRFELIDEEALARLLVLAQATERTAEFALLRGALALERGDTPTASEHFHTALRLAPRDGPIRPLASYFRALLAAPPEPRQGASP